MIVASSPSTGTRYRVLRAGADPFANPSWTAWSAAPKIPGIGAVPASGPNGVWALAQTSILDGQRQLLFRLRGSQFVRPRSLGTIGGPGGRGQVSNDLGQRLVGSGRDFTEDAGGRLHAAWSRYEVCGPRRQCLLYRRNEPRGFGPPVVYPLPLTAGAPSDLQLAPNAGGSGWLVWRGGVGSGAPNLATPLVTPPRGSRVGSKRAGPRPARHAADALRLRGARRRLPRAPARQRTAPRRPHHVGALLLRRRQRARARPTGARPTGTPSGCPSRPASATSPRRA